MAHALVELLVSWKHDCCGGLGPCSLGSLARWWLARHQPIKRPKVRGWLPQCGCFIRHGPMASTTQRTVIWVRARSIVRPLVLGPHEEIVAFVRPPVLGQLVLLFEPRQHLEVFGLLAIASQAHPGVRMQQVPGFARLSRKL